MPIRWLMIFFVLTIFILIDSDGLPANYTENQQRAEGDSADNVNYPNEGSTSLSDGSDSGVSTDSQRISTCSNHQETTGHRRNENKEMSAEKNYQDLITALSKIAKIKSSKEDPARCSMENVYNAQKKSTYLQSRIFAKNTGGPISRDTKLVSEDIFNNAPNDVTERGNFHCRAIQDIYIPEIKEKVPSYACTFGDNTFILSSKRFFQDRRSSLHVNIDNDTLRKLNSSTTFSTNSQFHIIPAVLVLKPWHENYDIRNPQNFQDLIRTFGE
ncbi:hypothetical protein ACFW04_006007 [Cataglyphis niger]